jgi:hypothetical protein
MASNRARVQPEMLKKIAESFKGSMKNSMSPSIPSNLAHWGYIRDSDKYFVLELEHREEDALGPGTYDPKRRLVQPRIRVFF